MMKKFLVLGLVVPLLFAGCADEPPVSSAPGHTPSVTNPTVSTSTTTGAPSVIATTTPDSTAKPVSGMTAIDTPYFILYIPQEWDGLYAGGQPVFDGTDTGEYTVRFTEPQSAADDWGGHVVTYTCQRTYEQFGPYDMMTALQVKGERWYVGVFRLPMCSFPRLGRPTTG